MKRRDSTGSGRGRRGGSQVRAQRRRRGRSRCRAYDLARRAGRRTNARWSASSSPSRSASGSPPTRSARCTPRPRRPRARSRADARSGAGSLGAVRWRPMLLVAVSVVRDAAPPASLARAAALEAAQLVAFSAPNNPVTVSPTGVVVDASAVAVLPFVSSGDATLATGLERDVVAALPQRAGPLRHRRQRRAAVRRDGARRGGDRRVAWRARHRRRSRRSRRRTRPRQRATARRRDRSNVMAGGRRQARRRAERDSLRDRRERRCDDARLELARAGRARGPLERACLREQTVSTMMFQAPRSLICNAIDFASTFAVLLLTFAIGRRCGAGAKAAGQPAQQAHRAATAGPTSAQQQQPGSSRCSSFRRRRRRRRGSTPTCRPSSSRRC